MSLRVTPSLSKEMLRQGGKIRQITQTWQKISKSLRLDALQAAAKLRQLDALSGCCKHPVMCFSGRSEVSRLHAIFERMGSPGGNPKKRPESDLSSGM